MMTRGNVLSNTALPVDTSGLSVLTGEASALVHGGQVFFFFNDWGPCPGIDCCPSAGGCASCCYVPPTAAYPVRLLPPYRLCTYSVGTARGCSCNTWPLVSEDEGLLRSNAEVRTRNGDKGLEKGSPTRSTPGWVDG